ncbi:MAG TPA: hypothetical protein VHB78_06955 [Vicinamibacterales bacterium]|jgi:hypothetical protein|nr:hypothetical protein [Vicinamibacterales bacterium]
MSEKTAASLAQIDTLIPLLTSMPPGPEREELVEEAQSLRRAIAAFHMEAIRFRMFNVERLLLRSGNDAAQAVFDALRHELETAGFHTRSHAAP